MLAERDNQAEPPAPDKPKRGCGHNGARPSTYDIETAQAIALAYATSSKPLLDIVNDNPDFPAYSTVYEWRDAHEEFRTLLQHARERRADLLVEECMPLSDQVRLGRKVKWWKGEEEITEDDAIERSKLQVSTRLRLAKFLNPAKYGDRVEVSGTVTLEALILASMKLDEPRKPAAIEGRARVLGPADPDDDGAL